MISPLPHHRNTPGPYRIELVCLGNICRSPIADVVLMAHVRAAGLGELVEVSSSGTAHWHVGKEMDPRSAATLAAAGYDPSRHRARQVDATRLERVDVALAMDAANLGDLIGLSGSPAPSRLRMFRDFDPVDPGGEVPDPYYGGDAGFQEVLVMVERTVATVVAQLRELPLGTPGPRSP